MIAFAHRNFNDYLDARDNDTEGVQFIRTSFQ